MRKRIFNLKDSQITIPENEVHIWNFDLNKHINQIEVYTNILSGEELNRAGRFHFERDKSRFIMSRGLLRTFISIYSEFPVKEIMFEFNSFGKPSLQKEFNNSNLHFNLSHSKNFLSIGFVKSSLIGIDVELMKPLKDHLEIAKRFFSPAEVEQLISLPAEKLLDGFYSCWTAKEAVIKLSGEGLSFPLKEFEVELKDLKIGESYKYKINLRKRPENLSVEVYKLNNTLYGACAVNNIYSEFIHCYFDDENATASLLS